MNLNRKWSISRGVELRASDTGELVILARGVMGPVLARSVEQRRAVVGALAQALGGPLSLPASEHLPAPDLGDVTGARFSRLDDRLWLARTVEGLWLFADRPGAARADGVRLMTATESAAALVDAVAQLQVEGAEDGRPGGAG